MAQSLECIHCGYQETPHLHPEYLPEGAECCFHFDDGIKHLKDCPRKGCAGNCKATIAKQDWEATVVEHRMRNVLVFLTDRYGRKHIGVADMGS